MRLNDKQYRTFNSWLSMILDVCMVHSESTEKGHRCRLSYILSLAKNKAKQVWEQKFERYHTCLPQFSLEKRAEVIGWK